VRRTVVDSEARTGGEAGVVKGNGWGGRRHGFRRSGKSETVTVYLSPIEERLLAELMVRVPKRYGPGDSTQRVKGGWAKGAIFRLALLELARAEGLEVPSEDELRLARKREEG
jgi:hypothetical protein